MPRSVLSTCLALFLLPALAGPSGAEAPDSLWQRTFGGDQPDYGRSAREVAGGYVTVGFSRSFGGIDYDIYLVRTDGDGDTVWTRAFGGTGYDGAQSVRPTSDGGFIIAGYTDSFGAGGYDAYLIKTDGDGDTVWTRTYGARGDDFAYAVYELPHGGFLAAGYSDSYSGDDDFLLIKANSTGGPVWTKTYGGARSDQCLGFDLTSDGGCVLVGSSNSFTSPTSDVLVVKVDADGDSVWMRNYGGPNNDYGNSIEETDDGGFVVTGSIDLGGTVGHQAYLLRLRANGTAAWEKAYGGGSVDVGHDVESLAGDDGYVICGYTTSYGGGQEDVYLVRTDAAGDTLWTGTYGDSLRDWGFEVQQTLDGGFIIAGSAMSYPPPAGDNFYLLKTRPDPARAPRPEGARGSVLSVRAAPNPAAAGTAIDYVMPRAAHLTLSIYDVRGRLVRDLVDAYGPAGRSTARWDGCEATGEDAPAGVYFCRLRTPGETASAKLVLTR